MRNTGGTSQYVYQRGHTGEGPYQDQVESGGNYDTLGFPGGPPSSVTYMYCHYTPPKGEGVIQIHCDDGGGMVNYYLHHKYPPQCDCLPT